MPDKENLRARESNVHAATSRVPASRASSYSRRPIWPLLLAGIAAAIMSIGAADAVTRVACSLNPQAPWWALVGWPIIAVAGFADVPL